MSDEEEDNSAEEEDDEDEEDAEDDEGEEEEEEEEEEEGDEQNEDDDQDEEEADQQDQQEDQQQNKQESKEQNEGEAQKLPKFRSIEPQEFKFANLLSEISSLSVSVDRFINSLPSQGGSPSYYRTTYIPPPLIQPEVPLILPREQSRVVMMKDEDTQVSMQPQIVIQPTKIEKLGVEPSYKISNESSKFLAQLYQQNKKLKRWQNSSHNINNHQGGSSLGSGFYGSRERFERQEYEKGLFNVEERNKQIDQAIQMLKRQNEA